MNVERIIGIDFGTSTSVMRVKRYQENGQSVDDRLYTAEVKFANSSLVPTLIRKMQTGEPYYGYDAQKGHKKSTLYDNFKVNLESPDPQEREQARALTEEFFAYLAKQYRDQSSGGFFGEADETERTLISYPVKWSEETRRFMLEAAKKAGFKHVEGMDEAQAAITVVMVQSAEYLSRRGYLQDGVPANILMADMGAGTTDLVLCRYTPGKSAKYEILSAWPRDGGTLFGGREVEGMLQDYLRSKLPEEDVDTVMKKCRLDMFKSWKEDYVSPALARDEAVTECADMETVTDLLEIDVEEYSLDRTAFEKMASQYLKGFPALVNGCLKDAGLSGDAVDLVLLTGGHSQWYFVREQLCGKLNQFGAVGLGKIQADPERIIPVPRPQETVALGLVYGPLAREVRFAGKEEAQPESKPAGQAGGEAKSSRRVAERVEVKPISKPVHKEETHTNTESEVWDESMRVLPVTPEEEFKFQRVGGNYKLDDFDESERICQVPDGYEVKYSSSLIFKGEKLSIPAYYRGKPVVAVGEMAFNMIKDDFKQVEIPGTCRVIGHLAFSGETVPNWFKEDDVYSLEKIIFHPGLRIIDRHAFYRNIKLISLSLPNGLTEIRYGAFEQCDLREIHIPSSVRRIRARAFQQNRYLSSVEFSPDAQIEEIDEMAFLDTNVKRIKLPARCKCEKLLRKEKEILQTFQTLYKTPKPAEYIAIERF